MTTNSKGHVWMDGALVPWDDARVHVNSDGVLKGENVFEGLRAYWNADERQLFVFRLDDHLRRLWQSAKIMRMTLPYSHDQMRAAVLEILRANELGEHAHVRVVVYFGAGQSNAWEPDKIKVNAFIIARPGARTTTVSTGLHTCVSSWRRISDESFPPRIKAGANYHNARLGTVQARIDGYDQPIFLNDRGKVSEGGGACLFIVRDGVAITPPVNSDILEGITRDTILRIAQDDLGLPTLERDIDRTEMYIADEAFFCGSLHEIQPIISVDRLDVGEGRVGEVTRRLQERYFQIAEGRDSRVPDAWTTPVYPG